jgi:ketol-acid reductoisomerase
MIKRYLYVTMAALLTTVAFIGCGKSNKVNTGKLESSFSSADSSSKSKVDAAVSAIKAGNYSDALAKLQAVAAQAKLTPEQKQAVQDVVAQVQKQLTAAAGQAQKDANKAAGDLQKSLGK